MKPCSSRVEESDISSCETNLKESADELGNENESILHLIVEMRHINLQKNILTSEQISGAQDLKKILEQLEQRKELKFWKRLRTSNSTSK